MPTTTLLSLALSLAPQQEPEAPAHVAPAVRATNELGIALYKALDREQPGKNLFLSPLSITVAMAMLTEGARDETLGELRQALHLDANTPLADLHAGFQALLSRYRDGGGDPDPALRERIAALRREYSLASDDAEKAAFEDTPSLTARAARDRANALGAQIDRLASQVDRYELRVANALWIERTIALVPAFTQTLDRFYGTSCVASLDMFGNHEAARLRINAWVEEHTERHITDLIAKGDINATTRLVITNAVFFRGQWADPFHEGNTREEDFVLAGGSHARAKLMRDASRVSVPYAAFTGDGRVFATPLEVPAEPNKRPATYPGDDGFTMVELAYKGRELAMLVLVPRSADGLPRLERTLDAISLASWTRELRSRTVDVSMLRFEQRGTFELARALQAAGVRLAFAKPREPGGAGFGGIADGSLSIDFLRHQAWLQVDEKGTEAAGDTTGGTPIGIMPMVPFVPVFRADRPFLFLIRDTKSGAILFLGRVTDPRT